jgi:hypothetical protein
LENAQIILALLACVVKLDTTAVKQSFITLWVVVVGLQLEGLEP